MEYRLKFIEFRKSELFIIENIIREEKLGIITKRKIGAYMHWVFEPDADTYFSAGCMDEIREFMKNPDRYKEKYPEVVK